jgi:hypothetical protein
MIMKSRSLAAYTEKFSPLRAIRLGGRNTLLAPGGIIDLPLYLAGQIERYLTGRI